MKNLKLTMIGLAAILFGCQQVEIVDPNEVMGQTLKTVTISADMGVDTKASLDSQTGEFTWQSGDLISVLATDGKFYDFILKTGAGAMDATFEGQIPEEAQITTVATYPRIVANGTENTVCVESTLNYVLPETWTWMKDVSNVPMVAAFEAGATDMSFRQVGGVMRFPVKNMPLEATFVMTMNDKDITGEFPVDLTKVGETAMVAGTEPSTLTINYSSNVDGASVEFNVPVPTGVYDNFKLEIKDKAGEVLYAWDYTSDINKVERATLLNMSEITLPSRAVAAPTEAWPFFSDARVFLPKHEGVTKYAIFVDDAEPVVVEPEVSGEQLSVMVGGDFALNSTHSVAYALVVDDVVLTSTKSEALEFKTADIRQLTANTGTKFVSVGWDDVAVSFPTPKYENGLWTAVPKTKYVDVEETGLKMHQLRGYEVRLLADDMTTVVYQMIPFCGHEAFTSPFSDSSWIGKLGDNIMMPTALTFGYLEPGKDYYFQVRTLAEPVTFDATNGNYIAKGDTSQPNPYLLKSQRGGCAWSPMVKVSTDAETELSETLVFHEGFDDVMLWGDYMNWAPAMVPDMVQESLIWDDYAAKLAEAYPAWLALEKSARKYTFHAFSEPFKSDELGFFTGAYDESNTVPNILNANAGPLEGWGVASSKVSRNLYPAYGCIRLGQSGSNKSGATLFTPPIYSEYLEEEPLKATVKLQLAHCSTSTHGARPTQIKIEHWRGGTTCVKEEFIDFKELYPEEWAAYNALSKDSNNYVNWQRYYEVEFETYFADGDELVFMKPTSDSYKGMLVIGDIKIEVEPGVYEE
jgi:hypothetical protein